MTVEMICKDVDGVAIIKNIREKVTNNQFYICSRLKNEEFKRKFRFTKKSDFASVILKLNKNDYVKCSMEEQPDIYGTGNVYIFLKRIKLYNFNGEKEEVQLYIKIKIPDKEMDYPVISFHESEIE